MLRALLAIYQKSQEPSFLEVIVSCFISISKLVSLNRSFETTFNLPELYFRFREFILLGKQNAMAAALAAENHGDK